MTPVLQQNELEDLMRQFVDATPDVLHALAVSADGITVAWASRRLVVPEFGERAIEETEFSEQEAAQLGAVASGLTAMNNASAHAFQLGTVASSLVECEQGYVLALSRHEDAEGPGSNGRSSLLVAVGTEADVGLVIRSMTDLLARVGHALTPLARTRMHVPQPIRRP